MLATQIYHPPLLYTRSAMHRVQRQHELQHMPASTGTKASANWQHCKRSCPRLSWAHPEHGHQLAHWQPLGGAAQVFGTKAAAV